MISLDRCSYQCVKLGQGLGLFYFVVQVFVIRCSSEVALSKGLLKFTSHIPVIEAEGAVFDSHGIRPNFIGARYRHCRFDPADVLAVLMGAEVPK